MANEGPVRLVQAGLGGFGRNWAGIARDAPGFDLVAVVDPVPAAREWAVGTLGIAPERVFASLAEAVAVARPEAALVVTPPATHDAVAREALGHGLHVLLEKPLATTLAEARGMIAAADAAGRHLLVSQQYRHRWPARAARAALGDGVVGPLAAVRVRFARDTSDLFPPADFRYTMPHPLVLDMSIHHVDLLRAVTGREVARVYAQGWRVPGSRYATDPACVASLTLDDGTPVVYDGDWAATGPETSWNADWEFLGERGRLTWTGPGDDALAGTLVLHPVGGPARELPVPAPAEAPADRPAVLAQLRRAVREGVPADTDARDNIRSLAVVLACVASIETGEVVAPGA